MTTRIHPLVGFLILPLACAQGASVIVNGSFETVSGGLPQDWVSSGNLGVTVGQGTTDGTFAVAFSLGNVPSNGVLSQTFTTVPGQTYNLQFDFGKYSVNQPTEVARLQVDVFDGATFGGAGLLTQLVTDATPGPGSSVPDSSVYDTYDYTFTALGTSSTLRFVDLSDAQSVGGGFDAMLDRVSVSPVPEAGTSGLLGLLAILMMGRRRKSSGRW